MNHTNETITHAFNEIEKRFKLLEEKQTTFSNEQLIKNEQFKNILEKINNLETRHNELNKIILKHFAYRKNIQNVPEIPPQPEPKQTPIAPTFKPFNLGTL